MKNEREKSDPSKVAKRPANKPKVSEVDLWACGAESAEPREGTEGNTGEQHTCRTPSRASVSQGHGGRPVRGVKKCGVAVHSSFTRPFQGRRQVVRQERISWGQSATMESNFSQRSNVVRSYSPECRNTIRETGCSYNPSIQ